jgi:predicted DCC family thiol-disulfide oxidoreductase YuxK
MSATAPVIVLFDGVCNLCNFAVQFMIDRDPTGQLKFASLQSEYGQDLLRRLGVEPPKGELDAFMLVEGRRLSTYSTATLRVLRYLRGPIKVLLIGWILPRSARDALYRFVARHRYRWFGRTESCRLPTPALKARFLG